MITTILTTITISLLSNAPAHADERVALQLDRSKSHVVAITRKSGIFGFLGHEHAIHAPLWTAQFALDPGHPSKSNAEITLPVESFEIDTARARELAELKSGAPDEDDAKKIQAKMMGPEVLDAAKHPTIRFKTQSVEAKDKGQLILKGDLTLHGVTRETTTSVTVEPASDGTLTLTGSLTVKLSDHGIDPPSTAGIGVKDEIEIRFSFRTRSTTAVARL